MQYYSAADNVPGLEHRRPLNVLYIEDDLALGLLMKTALENYGDTVETALTGEEGLKLYKTGNFDIVAIDYQLPDMTGIDIGRKILLETPDMPLIMITGRGNERLASEALKLGFVEYLVKDDADVFLELVPSIVEHCWNRQLEAERLRSTQEQLSEVTGRFEHIVQLSPDGVILISENEVVYANAAMDGLFGDAKASDLIGCTLSSLIPEDASDGLADTVERVIEAKTPRETIQIQIEAPDENKRYLDIAAGYCEFSGKPAAQMVVRDVTEEKLIAEELRVAKVNADLANKAKSDFLSSMSHELRTPMNAILGFSQLLLLDSKSPISDQQRKNVGQILQSGEHLLSLIDDLLDLAKIESGKFHIAMDHQDIIPLIDEAVAMMTPSSSARGIAISIDAGAIEGAANDPAHAWVDPTRFRQIMVNLISNAVKYNKDDGQINIALTTDTPETIRISVQDTGIGIPDELAVDLFEPFNRLGAEASSIEGTGIGLPITKKLIELMGGSVGYESTSGVGSTFWVEVSTTEKQ